MAHAKYDGVIEAVRYASEGQVGLVRVYERRGATFSDRVLLTREELVRSIQSGKRFVTGDRQLLMASTFDIRSPINLVKREGNQFLVTTGEADIDQDELRGVPLF
jgi:hypothetical protein